LNSYWLFKNDCVSWREQQTLRHDILEMAVLKKEWYVTNIMKHEKH
jgi:hypothetical protein